MERGMGRGLGVGMGLALVRHGWGEIGLCGGGGCRSSPFPGPPPPFWAPVTGTPNGLTGGAGGGGGS